MTGPTRSSGRGGKKVLSGLLPLVILFACRAGPLRNRPRPPRQPLPTQEVAVTLPPEVTVWMQDLVHSGRFVYGLSLPFGVEKLPGLWRVNVDTGQFSLLRFTSGTTECRLALNSFQFREGSLEARFFCPAGCEPGACRNGEIREASAASAVVMSFRGETEGDWSPAVSDDPKGSVEGWRYHMENLRETTENEPGGFTLVRGEERVRGRE